MQLVMALFAQHRGKELIFIDSAVKTMQTLTAVAKVPGQDFVLIRASDHTQPLDSERLPSAAVVVELTSFRIRRRLCGNAECKSGAGAETKVCDRCYSVSYCSPGCQVHIGLKKCCSVLFVKFDCQSFLYFGLTWFLFRIPIPASNSLFLFCFQSPCANE
jgi:hypothetical protein